MTSFASWRPRRIAIIGAGAMGTSLGAMLGRVAPVVMVCRTPSRRAQLQERGARAHGKVEALARPEIVESISGLGGGISAIFVATKTTAIPEVAAELRPLLGTLGDQPGAPFVVSYQNGIEPGRQLMELLEDDRVLRMVLNFGARLDPSCGDVEVTLSDPPHSVGCLNPAHRPVCQQLGALLTSAGLSTVFDERIEARVWFKGVVNAAMNPVAAVVNATVGQVLDSPARTIVDRLLWEGFMVALAEGIDLGEDPLRRAMRVLDSARPHTPSMVEDIRSGRESEVGQLNRQILDHAKRLGVPVPTHELVDALIETFDWKVYAREATHAPPLPAMPTPA